LSPEATKTTRAVVSEVFSSELSGWKAMPAPLLKVAYFPCSRSEESAKKVSTPCTPMFELLLLIARPKTWSDALFVRSATSSGAE
jgi:hypothetical protein